MIQLSRKIFSVKIRRRILRRVSFLSRCLMRLWEKVLRASKTKSIKYKHLLRVTTFAGKPSVTSAATPAALPPLPPPPPPPPPPLLPPPVQESSPEAGGKDPDLVALKISLLGDSQTGKTSFVVKYVGNEKEKRDMQTSGINLMDKTLYVRGARISYCIWEVGGDEKAHNHIPMACKDSVAILYMFDLTSRCTLNSVISWYHQARKWNQNAIPVLIGTKFDDFIQLPMEMQWTVASQARGYAKALNATLFFSSSTYNINVNKIFKFITAKLFNLPWTVERNLTVGEPIIDF